MHTQSADCLKQLPTDDSIYAPCSANRLNHVLHRKEHLKRDGQADTAPHLLTTGRIAEPGRHVIIDLPIAASSTGRGENKIRSLLAVATCREIVIDLSIFGAEIRKQKRNRRSHSRNLRQAELAMSVVSGGCLWLP
jgi:hypothetical protein